MACKEVAVVGPRGGDGIPVSWVPHGEVTESFSLTVTILVKLFFCFLETLTLAHIVRPGGVVLIWTWLDKLGGWWWLAGRTYTNLQNTSPGSHRFTGELLTDGLV